MRDCAPETDVYPARCLELREFRSLICFAPHPDDEVIGCGGLMALVSHHTQNILTIILTDGQAQCAAQQDRRAESLAAALHLGLPEPEFWGLKDRGLGVTPSLVERIERLILERRPSHLLVPALTEPHPDHQVLALAVSRAAERSGLSSLTLLFYEVGAPMVPNCRVDITSVAERKWSAMACFHSQLSTHPYTELAKAMATLRAHGLGSKVVAAEAFFEVPLADLSSKFKGRITPSASNARRTLQLAEGGVDLPLVSVLIRSSGRASLSEALESLAVQHYSNLEVVLVASQGQMHDRSKFPSGLLIREVSMSPSAVIGRARAANLGLDAAQGEFALFLDDDDLIHPDHLARLVSELLRNPSAPAAYAGVRVENRDGETIGIYDEPWSSERLMALNFIPIHAVLFRTKRARDCGVGFDENLPVLEDWSFWRNLSQRAGAFVHVPGISAVYRKLDRGSGVSEPGENDWRVWQQRILELWCQSEPAESVGKLLAWHARELNDRLVELKQLQIENERSKMAHSSQITQLQIQHEEALRRAADDALQFKRSAEQQIAEAMRSRDNLQVGYEQQVLALVEDRERLRTGFEEQMAVLFSQRNALEANLRRVTGTRLWRWSSPIRSLLARWFQ